MLFYGDKTQRVVYRSLLTLSYAVSMRQNWFFSGGLIGLHKALFTTQFAHGKIFCRRCCRHDLQRLPLACWHDKVQTWQFADPHSGKKPLVSHCWPCAVHATVDSLRTRWCPCIAFPV